MYFIIIFLLLVILLQYILIYFIYREHRKEKRELLLLLGNLYKKGYHEILLNNALERNKDKIKEKDVFTDPTLLKHYQTINNLFKYIVKKQKVSFYEIFESIEMKNQDHVDFLRNELYALMKTPCSKESEHVNVLNEYYLIFFERTIQDHILPITKTVTKKDIKTAHNAINAFKSINDYEYSSLVEPFNTTIRNAIAHKSVKYDHKEKIITYKDRKGSLSLSKDDLVEELDNIQLIALAFDLHRDHLLRAFIMESKKKHVP